ncbi:hypothetical protein C8R46DRAFT_1162607 [Mycena filopes]|nr:hypothetical protein C8R46DRAFT_1162607 [Mycena filopes]
MAAQPVLRVQINQIDHYLAPPGSLDNSDLPSVPIIRIYGSSSDDKCCVHVHQVYPYFFVEYDGKLRRRSVDRYIAKLTHSLNYAIALSLKKDISFKPHAIRGIHFYGFHSSYSPFLKVYLANPTFLNRAVTILRSGTVMGTHFRIFESHLSFALQFMADFGLYGCGSIDLSDVFQRGQEGRGSEEWNEVASLPHSIFQPSSYFRQTRMPLEVDAAAFHILNRFQITARNLHHKLTIPAPLLPPEPLVLSVRELWEDERNRRRARGLNPSPDMPIDPSESSRTSHGEWVAEARWWEDIRRRMENERELPQPPESQNDWERWVMTTFESVEALWPEPWRTWKPTILVDQPETDAESAVDEQELRDEEIDVDDSLLSDEHSQLVEREAEWEKSLNYDMPDEDSEEVDVDLLPDDDGESQPNGDALSAKTPLSSTSSENGSDTIIPPPSKKRRIDPGEPSDSLHSARALSRRVMDINTQHFKTINLNRYVYALAPPSPTKLLETVEDSGIPRKIYRKPFYSNESDVSDKSRAYGGFVYKVKGNENSLRHLDDWEEHDPFSSTGATPSFISYSSGWEYSGSPPSVRQIKKFLASTAAIPPSKKPQAGTQIQAQIDGPTQANIYGLKTTPRLAPAISLREKQGMSILALEVFAPSTEGSCVDPSTSCSGTVVVDTPSVRKLRSQTNDMVIVSNELELLNHIVDVVIDFDPDSRWLDIADLISRAPIKRSGGTDQWGVRKTSTFKVCGRHVLNLWRVMRVEVTLNIYTFENVVFHVLSRRTPRYGPATLKAWYQDSIPAHTYSVLRYFSSRTSMVLEILEETEVVTKTAEFARVFGVDFFSVISRGSQFKVESFMFRIAKPESFVLLSPSKHDVGRMNAAEAMPLIMEPLSTFYTDPVSLYPSVMIAYNYCYSTFLGRINEFQGRQKFGVTDLDLPPGRVETLHEHINVSPTGMMFVKPEVRKGLLARMLVELLETRVMVKQAMKGMKHDDDKALRKILDARQLGLKFIANVTYGYTSATMSGRMPAVEIADSIVQSGRETLEKVSLGVVYGDTDSVFVHLPGKTKDQAFRIGHEMADTITSCNPSPIKLKFEKVYLPSVLLAKKRYVGFKYETPDDAPVFDAKGIETVRRDGVLAQKKMTETCPKILFRTQNLSEVKIIVTSSSWQKLLEGKASVEDFIFAKEVKMGTYSDKGPPPPGAVLAARQAITENIEPQYSERVPYVICRGPPNSRLVDKVASPLEVLRNRNLQLDADYYISRVLIPPLDRIFSLTGCDVRKWYMDMPKAKSLDIELRSPTKEDLEDKYIHGHFLSRQCLACAAPSEEDVCDDCYLNPESAMASILFKIKKGEKRLLDSHRICASCTKSAQTEPIQCESIDCAQLFARTRAEDKLDFLATLGHILAPNEVDPSPEAVVQ